MRNDWCTIYPTRFAFSIHNMILDGKKIAAPILQRIARHTRSRTLTPRLAVILIGNDARSNQYVSQKKHVALRVGIGVSIYALPRTVSRVRAESLIGRLARNRNIQAIVLQRPVPQRLATVHHLIPPQKDVDCLTPENQGLLWQGTPRFIPPTPAAILALIHASRVSLRGSHAVVIGRSNLVGRPVAEMLLASDATVTLCHSKTKNLARVLKSADIIVSAVGSPRIVKASMVKQGVIVIDVGISKTVDGKLVGDVDFARVSKKARAISPVPGGVGPLTVAMLMKNVVQAASAISIGDKK